MHASKSPVLQFEIGDMRNFVYLIIDWKSREACLVDPHRDLSPVDQAIRENRLKLRGILITHSHHDHVGGLKELMMRDPGLPVSVHPDDLHRIQKDIPSSALRLIQDGQKIPLGDLEIEVMLTPGHSPGECCFYIRGREGDHPPLLFSGDTVFIRDCGRTDFVGGSSHAMFHSLQRIKQLPPETIIYPGHHYQPESSSTLARELETSPPFRCKTVEELDALP